MAIAVAQAVQGHYGLKSDLWEHSAVVRELASHPIQPRHPQLLVDRPDAFFTPYHLAVGMLSRWPGWSPVAALSVMGVVNLGLLLFALRMFVTVLLGRVGPAFWALVFALLAWGIVPPSASGFFNLISLPSVAPYPSTLAYALSLLALAAVVVFLRGGSAAWIPAVLLAETVVLLIHPPTAMALYVAVGTLCLAHFNRGRRRACGLVAAAGVASVLLVLAWPYFSFLQASLRLSRWDANNRGVYVDVLRGTFLALPGVPLLLARLRDDRRDFLAVTFLALAAVYALGGLLHRWSYGRVLAFMVLLVQIAMADWLDRRLASPIQPPRGRADLAVRLGVPAILAIGLAGQLPGVAPAVPPPLLPAPIRERNCCVRTAARYAFLTHRVGQYEVVLADQWPSWVTPTFGGKVVAIRTPLAFVDDLEARRADVQRFFSPGTTTPVRRAIVERYSVSWVLVERAQLTTIAEPALGALGSIAYVDDRFVLVRVV